MMQSTNSFDAIVIGSGMSGGWAAKELCEKGLKTLVLERGRNVEHNKDYPTTNMMPWEFQHRGEIPYEIKKDNPVVSRCYAFREDAMHFFVKDTDHPYVQDKPFDWIRGYQVGGRSIMWARQTQRWSDYDFEGPKRDGFAVDWPIRYSDIAPWYSHVEKFVGISGNKDGIDTLPDGEFLPAWGLSCIEDYFKKSVEESYKDRHVIYARCAHLSEPQPIHLEQGRGQCLSRNLCQRGCPFGAYFNSNSSTIPWAAKTGNLTLRPFSVVHSIIYDEAKGKATGVRVVDANTKESIDFFAPVIFVNAGSVNTNLILLNSTSSRFPNGLGNDSGLLGKYFAFHNYRAHINARYDGLSDVTSTGGRPTSAYIPRFRNIKKQETDFLRGYAATFYGGRWGGGPDTSGHGEELKAQLMSTEPRKPGPWFVGVQFMGETIPKETNFVSLDSEKKDAWGIPLIKFNVDYDDNDEKMIKDFFEQYTEMFTKAGFTDIQTGDDKRAPGLDIHEMGGVRMGHDPKTSLLNKWHQMHTVPNVFVSDGACMTSTSTQNPSLTYMAMTARAVDHAVSLLKKGELK
ncbi:MAG TPA: GMC family oxidoreductase [Cyclobacteriaceae bacterium]|nr:GMC family oxidoreductase [Cyclobacteriaceae bacterium]